MTKQKKEIYIIQIGKENWAERCVLPERVEWRHLSLDQIGDFLAEYQAQKDAFLEEQKLFQQLAEKGKLPLPKPTQQPPQKFQGLLLTEEEYPEEIVGFEKLVEPYSVFYGENFAPQNSWTQEFLRRTLAQSVSLENPDDLVARLNKGLFRGQYGAKLYVEDLQVSPHFKGDKAFYGNRHLILNGDYGPDFQQIAYWTDSLSFHADSAQDIFLDHLCGEGVETQIVVRLFQEGSTDHIIKEWIFPGNGSHEERHLNYDAKGYLSIALFAKGRGELKIGPCHYRFSRCGFGEFVLGGERYVDEQQDEFMYYFHPQDFKPPLCVYFSGWRKPEGFEAYGMMKGLGTPFMLICDPRLLGGSFYMGSENFERRVVEVIQEKLDFLGFDSSQLVLSGLSMGTFGAAYHGSQLHPHAVVIGKPVLSLGEVALKEKIIRPGGFKTSLDLLKVFGQGELSIAEAEKLDERFWRVFKKADFNQTKFIVSYMIHEDYDSTAFKKIIEYQKDGTKGIVLKGIPGRHNDNFGVQVRWFITQYQNVLKNDFGREY